MAGRQEAERGRKPIAAGTPLRSPVQACPAVVSPQSRWLSCEAPRLLLPACTRPEGCSVPRAPRDRRAGGRRSEEVDAFRRPVTVLTERSCRPPRAAEQLSTCGTPLAGGGMDRVCSAAHHLKSSFSRPASPSKTACTTFDNLFDPSASPPGAPVSFANGAEASSGKRQADGGALRDRWKERSRLAERTDPDGADLIPENPPTFRLTSRPAVGSELTPPCAHELRVFHPRAAAGRKAHRIAQLTAKIDTTCRPGDRAVRAAHDYAAAAHRARSASPARPTSRIRSRSRHPRRPAHGRSDADGRSAARCRRGHASSALEVRERFGDEVAELVDGVTKLDQYSSRARRPRPRVSAR